MQCHAEVTAAHADDVTEFLSCIARLAPRKRLGILNQSPSLCLVLERRREAGKQNLYFAFIPASLLKQYFSQNYYVVSNPLFMLVRWPQMGIEAKKKFCFTTCLRLHCTRKRGGH